MQISRLTLPVLSRASPLGVVRSVVTMDVLLEPSILALPIWGLDGSQSVQNSNLCRMRKNI